MLLLLLLLLLPLLLLLLSWYSSSFLSSSCCVGCRISHSQQSFVNDVTIPSLHMRSRKHALRSYIRDLIFKPLTKQTHMKCWNLWNFEIEVFKFSCSSLPFWTSDLEAWWKTLYLYSRLEMSGNPQFGQQITKFSVEQVCLNRIIGLREYKGKCWILCKKIRSWCLMISGCF